jgi:hypothetical protein
MRSVASSYGAAIYRKSRIKGKPDAAAMPYQFLWNAFLPPNGL